MALSRAKLADIAYVASSVGSIYANPASTKTLVVGLTLHNTNTTPEVVQIHNVPDSAFALGTAGNGNKCGHISISANDTVFFEFPFGVLLTDQNDSIQATTTTASKVTVMVHGDQIT